jgi:glycosyltransferase involved in cell wall biosynthesis
MFNENNDNFPQKEIKNVLIVSMTHFFGGGESYIINLVDVISKYHRSYLLVSSIDLYHRLKGSAYIEHKKWDGYSGYLSYVIAVCRLINANKIDIIILNGQREIYLSVFLKLFFRIKTVTIRHTEFLFRKTFRERFRDYLFILCALFSDQVICVSKNVFNQLERRGIKNILTINNWANKMFSEANWEPLDDGYFHILIVSRLDKMKGHHDVFDACEGLKNVKIHLVGTGPVKDELKEQSMNLDVIFHGYKDDVLPYYLCCHLLILPSYSEGGPMCLLEGIAVGIPCLASDISSNREILNEDNLYKTGDTKELREKIKIFIDGCGNNHYDQLNQKGIKYLQLIEEI